MNKAKDKTAKTMTARIQLFFMFVFFFVQTCEHRRCAFSDLLKVKRN